MTITAFYSDGTQTTDYPKSNIELLNIMTLYYTLQGVSFSGFSLIGYEVKRGNKTIIKRGRTNGKKGDL